MNISTYLFWVTSTIFGLTAGHISLNSLRRYHLISAETQLKTFVTLCFLLPLLFFRWSQSHTFLTIPFFLVGLIATEFFIILWSHHQRKKNFYKRKIPFLEDIILNLNMGLSLRESISKLKSQYSSQLDLNEIVSSFHLNVPQIHSLALHSEAQELWQELQRIYQSQHNTKAKLIALKDRYKQQQRWTERIEIAAQGPRAQLYVVSLIFSLVLLYRWNTHQSFVLSGLGFLALGLFGVGAYLIRRLSRSINTNHSCLIHFLQNIVYWINSGHSLTTAIQQAAGLVEDLKIREGLQTWLKILPTGLGTDAFVSQLDDHRLGRILKFLERGLKGESIGKFLLELSQDLEAQDTWHREKKLATLQTKMTIVLVVFVLPSYMLLLLGPELVSIQL